MAFSPAPWPAPPPSHANAINRMSNMHNPFANHTGIMVFHYDFLKTISTGKFLFYGYTDDGYIRVNDFVFYMVREPARVMMREGFIPDACQTPSRESDSKWVLRDDGFTGLVIQSTDTKQSLLEINFMGDVSIKEPVVPHSLAPTQVTIWDMFSDREY
jgi:hypothetical protein